MDDFFKDFFLIPYSLVFAAALFFELAAWNVGKVSIALRGERGLRAPLGEALAKWGQILFWSGACLGDVAGIRQHPHLVVIWVGCGAAGLLAAFWLSWRAPRVPGNKPEPLQISRGALYEGVGAVRRKAGMSC